MYATYDKDADAVYMQFFKGKVHKTVEVGSSKLADYDKKGRLIGLEILNATKQVPQSILKKFVRIDK